ncbi:GABA permease, partial [Bacillus pumilus]
AAIIQYWYGDAPVWLTSRILTILLTVTNISFVKSFGEFEYWSSLIKVVSIILFLLIGFSFIFGFGGHHTVGLANLTGNG